MPMGHDREIEVLLLRHAQFGQQVKEILSAADLGRSGPIEGSALMALCVLDLDGPRRPQDLAYHTYLTSAGVSRLVDRLEDSGLVERISSDHSEDGRAVDIRITAAGEDHLAAVNTALNLALEDASTAIKEMNVALDRWPGTTLR